MINSYKYKNFFIDLHCWEIVNNKLLRFKKPRPIFANIFSRMNNKYRFRLVYFNCYDNRAIDENLEMTNVFRRRQYAESIAKGQRERENHKYLWEKDKVIRKVSTEGFYLVHESLFEEVLSQYAKDG